MKSDRLITPATKAEHALRQAGKPWVAIRGGNPTTHPYQAILGPGVRARARRTYEKAVTDRETTSSKGWPR